MSEIKPRSMRMSDENYSRLQSLSEGRSLDETISHLLGTYDKNEERNSLGGQAIKLDELDEFLNAIRSQFAALLHTCQNAKEVVRSEYARELEEKNGTIESQKEEILKLQKNTIRKDASAQEAMEQLRSQLQDVREKNDLLEEKLRDGEKTAAQKQQAMDSLAAALTAAEKKTESLEDAKNNLAETKNELLQLQTRYAELEKEHKNLQERLEKTGKQYQKQLEEAREALNQKETSFTEQLQASKKEAEEKIQQMKQQQEAEIRTLHTQTELSIREARIQAQSQINEIKEEYQNKLFQLMLKENS